MSLNVNEWGEVIFGDLIDEIYKGKAYSREELNFCKPYEESTIPYVTRTDLNNSVDGFVKKNDTINSIEKGNAIVIGDTTATVTYQKDDFICGDHIVIIRAKWLNEYTGLFFTTLLNKERYKYCYGRAFVKKSICNTRLLVPIKEGKPDFYKMEDIIKQQRYKYLTTKNKKVNNKIDVSNWREFIIGDENIFDVTSGTYHYGNEYEEGDTPYITATNRNNGINEKINLPPEYKGNAITVEKVNACTFYQPEDFCATSDVNILRAKFDMNKYVALFIASVINFNEGFRWNYGRQCRINNTKKMRIKLPAKMNNDGEYIPDIEFMENYIKSLPYGDRI